MDDSRAAESPASAALDWHCLPPLMRIAASLALLGAAHAQEVAKSCANDAACPATHFCRPTTMDWSGRKACVAFSEPGASCGGMAPPNYQTRCAPTLECVNSMGPMVMDAPGSCAEACPIAASSPIAAREQRDSWGNCIAAGCSNWFDGCNACTSTNGMQTCTEMFCAQPTGPAECRDAPATLIKPTAAAADECCTNHRRVLGLCAPPAGCCRGITAECVACNQGCSVEAYCGPAGPGYTSGVCAQVSDAYAAHPVAPQPVGVPEGCMAWFDGCNTCERDSATGSMGCTMMYCFAPESTACRGWAVGYGDGKGH